MPTFSRGILFAGFWSQTATESERCFLKSALGCALDHSSADFATEIYLSREKAYHANAPIMWAPRRDIIIVYAWAIIKNHCNDPIMIMVKSALCELLS